MKKYILPFILAAIILCFTASAYASFQDVPQGASYSDALGRVTSLGIMSGVGNNLFQPDSVLTREQFSKIIIVSAGLQDSANSLKGSTIFPDIDPTRWSNGFINAALNNGFVAGMPDGTFHPAESVTFAQACTVLVKALGYTDQDVPGLWPRNYVDKAKSLGLADGITLDNNAALPRWAAAVMIDKLLAADVKNTNAAQASVTFADKSGLYTECIILGNSSISDKISANQVLTDKGIFYLDNPNTSFELGNKYRVTIDGDKITQSFDKLKTVDEITVDSAVDATISYKVGKSSRTMTLPDKTTYYYQGVKQTYDNLKNVLQADTSIVFSNNDDNTGYEYAVIFDPVYSKPQVAVNFSPATKKLGTIDFKDNPSIIKNGDLVDISQIEDKNVVYQVTNIWGSSKYILVLDKTVEGKITDILPNKLSPKTLQINNTNYDLSPDMDFNKINNTPGTFKMDDDVTAYIGQDGKIIDILYTNDTDNSMFAFVINYAYSTSTDIKDYGKKQYTVKLLLTDGTTPTYNIDSDPTSYKGTLVKFNKVNDQTVTVNDETVTLESLTYPAEQEYTIEKDDRMINTSLATNSIKIFNLISNQPNVDAQVDLLNWTDLPYGTVPSGKILYLNKLGAFDDVNLMLVNDILDQQYKTAVVEKAEYKSGRSGTSYNYTMLIDGKEYVFSSTYVPGISTGTVIKVEVSGTTVASIQEVEKPVIEAMSIQAIDSGRIKLNSTVYQFRNDVAIYYKDDIGNVTVMGVDDIETGKLYGKVSIYLDQSPYYGGKVALIVISE